MNSLQALILELQNITSKLIILIDQQNIEPALELIDRRLLILDEMQKISCENQEYKEILRPIALDLLPLEKDLMAKIEQQQMILADQLSKLNRVTKATSAYRNASKE